MRDRPSGISLDRERKLDQIQDQKPDVSQNSISIGPEQEPLIMKSLSPTLRANVGQGTHKYGAIPKSEHEFNHAPYVNEKAGSLGRKYDVKTPKERRKWWLATMTIGSLVMILSIILYRTIASCDGADNQKCQSVDHGYQCSPAISRYWGQYSPYFSVPSDISADVPDQCQVTFAQVLSRHGARDPTLHSTQTYHKLIDDIHLNATSYSNEFAFVKDYKYALGADMLSRFGQIEMLNSGTQFYNRYLKLARKITPFVRASGQTRVIESAQNWTQGFHQARVQDPDASDDTNYPYDILVISEEPGHNNTLDHGLCHEFENGSVSTIGNSAKETWASIFTPSITARMNSNMPGVNFTTEDTISFMSLCPFETVASESGEISPFCHLFSEEDWHAYDYYQTVGKYYKYSWGNPLGPTQGVGYANELIARLTHQPVEDHTSSNSTLDHDPKTFPNDETTILFADFSHDNTMLSVFSALGLFKSAHPPSNKSIEDAKSLKGFSTSLIVPFAGRAYFEKMKCEGMEEETVRIIINDRVMPLDTCHSDSLGRCKLGDFINSLDFARRGGEWDKC